MNHTSYHHCQVGPHPPRRLKKKETFREGFVRTLGPAGFGGPTSKKKQRSLSPSLNHHIANSQAPVGAPTWPLGYAPACGMRRLRRVKFVHIIDPRGSAKHPSKGFQGGRTAGLCGTSCRQVRVKKQIQEANTKTTTRKKKMDSTRGRGAALLPQ